MKTSITAIIFLLLVGIVPQAFGQTLDLSAGKYEHGVNARGTIDFVKRNKDLSGYETISSISNFWGTTFKSDSINKLDLTFLDFTGEVWFKSCTFNQVNFMRSKFNEVDFSKASFEGVTLIGVKMSKALFNNAKFLGGPLNRTQFTESEIRAANFTHAELRSVDFGCQLDSAIFKDARIDGARFHRSSFGYAGFRMARINNADFSNVHFNGKAIFDEATMGKVRFNSATFAQIASFRNLSLSDSTDISFSGVRLPYVIDFSMNWKVPTPIDFTVANWYRDSVDRQVFQKRDIYLHNTSLSNIHLDYIHFQLLFVDPVTKHELHNDEKESIYVGLLKNFSDRGQKDSYELLDIEYQRHLWEKDGMSFLSWIEDVWWGYGYRKDYVFRWALGLVSLFTLLNWPFIGFLNRNVYKMEALPEEIKGGLWMFWYSLVYTSTIFLALSLKMENFKLRKYGGAIYIMIIYTLGLLCLGYIANFIFQK